VGGTWSLRSTFLPRAFACSKEATISSASILWQSLGPFFSKGLPETLKITALLLCLGLVLGAVLGFTQVYGRRPFRYACVTYEQIFRGVPPLVMILIFYNGLARSFHIMLPATMSAVLALGLRSAAYQSQIFRGAIQAVPSGQMMAARSLGMSKLKAIRYVMLPQAFRLAIPPWSNEYSGVVKDTAFACAIGVAELTRQAQLAMTRVSMVPDIGSRLILPIFLILGMFYLALTYGGNALLGLLERRLRIPGFETKGKVER
jgi:polar amino acid transport system permease protein